MGGGESGGICKPIAALVRKHSNWFHLSLLLIPSQGPDMASYITPPLAQECFSRGIDANIHPLLGPVSKMFPKYIDSSKRYSRLPLRETPHYYLPFLRTPDMSASNMLIESPEKPSITCFLDWQGAIIAPIFTQATIIPTASSSQTPRHAYRLFQKTLTQPPLGQAGILPAAPHAIPVSVLSKLVSM